MLWLERAACRDVDPELFFPVTASGTSVLQVQRAMAVCRRCTVRDLCLEWALEHQVEHGVWGGVAERERRELARRRALAASA